VFLLQTINLDAANSSMLFWAWGTATLVLAVAFGFIAGVSYANRSADRGLRKAVTKLSSLYSLVLEALDKAHKVTQLLEKFPNPALSVDQVDGLDRQRSNLLEALGRVVSRHREAFAVPEEPKAKPKPQVIGVTWQRTSFDASTNLPDRAAFDANLRLMLNTGAESGFSCGLLLVRIDRMDQLRSRFGILGTDVFVKNMAALVSRAVRDQDLTCRLSLDSFGVLLPSVDAEAGRKLSQAVRNSVRFHTFRLQDVGPEVLVTASFGYTICPPGDEPELALARASDGVAQSIRRGRNQLHVFDGEAVVHCTAV